MNKKRKNGTVLTKYGKDADNAMKELIRQFEEDNGPLLDENLDMGTLASQFQSDIKSRIDESFAEVVSRRAAKALESRMKGRLSFGMEHYVEVLKARGHEAKQEIYWGPESRSNSFLIPIFVDDISDAYHAGHLSPSEVIRLLLEIQAASPVELTSHHEQYHALIAEVYASFEASRDED